MEIKDLIIIKYLINRNKKYNVPKLKIFSIIREIFMKLVIQEGEFEIRASREVGLLHIF